MASVFVKFFTACLALHMASAGNPFRQSAGNRCTSLLFCGKDATVGTTATVALPAGVLPPQTLIDCTRYCLNNNACAAVTWVNNSATCKLHSTDAASVAGTGQYWASSVCGTTVTEATMCGPAGPAA